MRNSPFSIIPQHFAEPAQEPATWRCTRVPGQAELLGDVAGNPPVQHHLPERQPARSSNSGRIRSSAARYKHRLSTSSAGGVPPGQAPARSLLASRPADGGFLAALSANPVAILLRVIVQSQPGTCPLRGPGGSRRPAWPGQEHLLEHVLASRPATPCRGTTGRPAARTSRPAAAMLRGRGLHPFQQAGRNQAGDGELSSPPGTLLGSFTTPAQFPLVSRFSHANRYHALHSPLWQNGLRKSKEPSGESRRPLNGPSDRAHARNRACHCFPFLSR